MDIGGCGLLHHYNDSPTKLLSAVYPDYNWLPWKFERAMRNLWDNPENQQKFMNWVATQLNIKEMHDWYRVTTKV